MKLDELNQQMQEKMKDKVAIETQDESLKRLIEIISAKKLNSENEKDCNETSKSHLFEREKPLDHR